MKTILYSTLLLIITLFSCEKDNLPNSPLVGEWRLVEYEISRSGISTNNLVFIPDEKQVIVSFSSKKEFNENYKNTLPKEFAFLGCGSGSYELGENNGLRIYAACMSSLSGAAFTIQEVSSNRLELHDEVETIFRFKRVD